MKSKNINILHISFIKSIKRVRFRMLNKKKSLAKAGRTPSRLDMNRQGPPPPLYPIQEKNRISCIETAHTGSMQHTRTWKKTYTGNDRQLQYLTRKLRAKIEM